MARVAFLLLLIVAGLASSSAQTYLANDTCSPTFNRPVYKNDPQVNPYKNYTDAQLQWRLTCPLPTKTCPCTTKGWIVAPYKLNFTSKVFSNNYPNSPTAWGSTARAYIAGIYSRSQCCNSCNQNSNRLQLDNGSFVSYLPTNTAVYYQGKIVASSYVASSTPVEYCSYWQHYVPAVAVVGTSCNTTVNPDACGYCLIYPPGATPPTCDTSQKNCTLYASLGNYRSGNYSTVGRGCAGGCNDPHFVGAHGTHFDFNGVPDESFCLITDQRFQVNMKMRGYYDARTVGASILRNGMAVRTWIKDLAVIWFDEDDAKHTLRIWARDGKSQTRDEGFVGGMELDGNLLPRIMPGETLNPRGLFSIQFLGYEKQGGGFFDVDVYRFVLPDALVIEIKLRIAHPLLQTKEDAMTHINVKFEAVEHTDSIHGVLGQTFREGREKRAFEYTALSRLMGKDLAADSELGAGFLDGTAMDYKTPTVLSADCKYSAFGGRALPL